VAEAVGRHLALSDASGFASYGLSLLPLYAGEIRAGRIAAESRGRWVHDAGSVLVIDGERGFGAPAASRALEQAMGAARQAGVALLAVRNAHHLGRIGAFAERSRASCWPARSRAGAPSRRTTRATARR
jgi:uncharacterized oxidoreductase